MNTQIAKIMEHKSLFLLVTIGSIAKFGENHRYAIEVLSQKYKKHGMILEETSTTSGSACIFYNS